MAATTTVAAVDLGSSSGRVVAGRYDGAAVRLDEVHRFAVHVQETDGALWWDVEAILTEVREGLARAARQGPLDAVSVDGWGVDHALLRADGTLAAPVRAYRDPRTADVPAQLAARAPAEVLWRLTGVRPDPINTSHQLVAGLRDEPALRDETDAVLMLPDYVAHRLGGERGWSRAICSTSGLAAPGAREWSTEVMDLLGLEPAWFGPLSDERTAVGTLAGDPRTPLLRAGSHDTACAVHALPPGDGDRAFLSSGSWSLVGVERDEALLDPAALEAGFTNEVRTDGGVRLLKNLTGLWILQECQRQWLAEGLRAEPAELVAEARAADSLGVVLDPAHPDLARPGPMADRVAGHLRALGAAPSGRAQLVRAVLESLAAAYARSVDQLARLTGTRPSQLVVVGGGARNTLLSEMTAAACRIPVLVGPVEASAAGSVLAQLETLGHLAGRDDGARALAASAPPTLIDPGDVDPALRRLADLAAR